LEKLNEVDAESGQVKIHGLASNPQEQRSSRDAQYFFVNGRFVRDQLIGRAVSEAYRSMMPAGTYPAVILFIELPPAEVDVNVHPAKTEVRFLHEGAMVGIVRDAIIRAIEGSRAVTRIPIPPGRQTVPGRGEATAGQWDSSTHRQTPINPQHYSGQTIQDAVPASPKAPEFSGADSNRQPPGLSSGVAGLSGGDEFRLQSPAQRPAPDRQPALGLSFGGSSTERRDVIPSGSDFPGQGDAASLSNLLADQFVEQTSQGGCDPRVLVPDTEPAAALPDLGHG